MIPTLVETYKVVDMFGGPITTNAAVSSAFINTAGVVMVEALLTFNQAVSFQSVLTLKEAKTLAGGSSQAITGNAQWWVNGASATTDTLVRGTDGLTLTLATGTTPQTVALRFMPALLDPLFSYINMTIATSSQATDLVAGFWLLYTSYSQATPPTAVV